MKIIKTKPKQKQIHRKWRVRDRESERERKVGQNSPRRLSRMCFDWVRVTRSGSLFFWRLSFPVVLHLLTFSDLPILSRETIKTCVVGWVEGWVDGWVCTCMYVYRTPFIGDSSLLYWSCFLSGSVGVYDVVPYLSWLIWFPSGRDDNDRYSLEPAIQDVKKEKREETNARGDKWSEQLLFYTLIS